ncbi:MAG TPA: hypothetical protein QGF05_13175 [Dehalococcoidia bacterium]|nr:hypothetical protein [Dehalococcoidia bacterium]
MPASDPPLDPAVPVSDPPLDPAVPVAEPTADPVPEPVVEVVVEAPQEWVSQPGWRYVATDLGLGLAGWTDCDFGARQAGGGLAEGQLVWALGRGIDRCTDWIFVSAAGRESWIPTVWLSVAPPSES